MKTIILDDDTSHGPGTPRRAPRIVRADRDPRQETPA